MIFTWTSDAVRIGCRRVRFTSPFNRVLIALTGFVKLHTNAYCLYTQEFKRSKAALFGITTDLEKRFREHNNKQSTYSSIYAPWELETYIVFKDKGLAECFEKYLKHGSGNALLKKRLVRAK